VAKALVQVLVGDDGVGDVAARAHDAHAGEAAAARSGQGNSVVTHEEAPRTSKWPADYI
jgi:hypothetical protein